MSQNCPSWSKEKKKISLDPSCWGEKVQRIKDLYKVVEKDIFYNQRGLNRELQNSQH